MADVIEMVKDYGRYCREGLQDAAARELAAIEAALTPSGPAPETCPHCGSEEWDRVTDRTAPGASVNRCNRCEREWTPADMEDTRANLKEAIARGRDPHLDAKQCAALVGLIDNRNAGANNAA